MPKCGNCGSSCAKLHQVECKKGCVQNVCHTCHGTPQAKIGTKCPSCGGIASWSKK